MDDRINICITIEYFQYLISMNVKYEGYIKGVGYAYIEYVEMDTPCYDLEHMTMCNSNIFYRPISLQRIDTAKDAILKSLKFFFILDVSKQSHEISKDIDENATIDEEEFVNYYENALKYKDMKIPYKTGGIDTTGMDCSGFICVALNIESHGWSTSSENKPAKDLEEIKTQTSSYEEFISCLKEGDILLWENRHVAFYAGGKSLLHASTSRGVGKTNDLAAWWLPNRGYPKVYRQIKK